MSPITHERMYQDPTLDRAATVTGVYDSSKRTEIRTLSGVETWRKAGNLRPLTQQQAEQVQAVRAVGHTHTTPGGRLF